MAGENRRVVESWIWLVFNPQVAECDAALRLVERSLSFRVGTQGFERLKTLGDTLSPEGALVFDDMSGDVPELDAIVAAHDAALEGLLQAARAAFKALEGNEALAEAVELARDTLVEADDDAALLEVKPAEAVAWAIESLVNDLAADGLPKERPDAGLWKAEAERLKKLAAGEALEKLRESRRKFTEAAAAAKSGLRALRKKYSRALDIPIAPTGRG
jgi:hypothetical protein